ncbi:MAG: hypothetical protein LUG16_00620 [Candidatus Gastranaerophilales bacterium]|nr:hypothetical protein [Candidatus Gastranaerophilales bacterium]
MAPIQGNSINPIYNTGVPSTNTSAGQSSNMSVQPQTQTMQQIPSNSIYQYPQTSIYDSTKQGASGVNIYIYNPTGQSQNCSGQTPQVCVTQPVNANSTASQPLETTPIANTPLTQNTTNSNNQYNGKTKQIVKLTDDYIQSLENALQDKDKSVRQAAIGDIIKRFEEEPSRFQNPSLTALLNIALQDSDASNRIMAMSPLATGSAKGDENTKLLLQNMQQSDKFNGIEAKMAKDALKGTAIEKATVPDYSPDKSTQSN